MGRWTGLRTCPASYPVPVRVGVGTVSAGKHGKGTGGPWAAFPTWEGDVAPEVTMAASGPLWLLTLSRQPESILPTPEAALAPNQLKPSDGQRRMVLR